MEARSKGSTQVWTKDPSQACLDRFGEPSKPVTTDDQHVLEAAVGQFGRTRWPQTSPLSAAWTQIPSTCLTPSVSTPTAMWAWRFTVPVLVPDLHHHSVQKDHRVERLQRPVLPLSDLVHHGLGDIADGLMGQLNTQPRGEVMLNLTDRHTGPHKGLMINVIKTTQPPLTSGHQPRGERAITIPGSSTGPTSASTVLGMVPLRKLPRTPPGRVVFLIAQVLGQPRPASRVPCTALTSSGNNPPSPQGLGKVVVSGV